MARIWKRGYVTEYASGSARSLADSSIQLPGSTRCPRSEENEIFANTLYKSYAGICMHIHTYTHTKVPTDTLSGTHMQNLTHMAMLEWCKQINFYSSDLENSLGKKGGHFRASLFTAVLMQQSTKHFSVISCYRGTHLLLSGLFWPSTQVCTANCPITLALKSSWFSIRIPEICIEVSGIPKGMLIVSE